LGNPPTIAGKLAKIVQTMMIMKAFGTDPLPHHLSKLDEIIQCERRLFLSTWFWIQ
jgi:hypothetical protein